MNLEDELRSALRRKEPSADFTARVVARVSAAPARRAARPWVRWVAAMAATVLFAVGAAEYQRYQGERAKSQVLLAVHIAATKLNKAHRKIQMLNAVHRSDS